MKLVVELLGEIADLGDDAHQVLVEAVEQMSQLEVVALAHELEADELEVTK